MKKKLKLMPERVQSQPLSDAARLMLEQHKHASATIISGLNATTEALIRALARLDAVAVDDGWRFNANTERWELARE